MVDFFHALLILLTKILNKSEWELPTLQYALLPLGIHKEHSNLKQDIVSHVFFLWVSMFGFVHMAWENAEISVRQ